MDSIELVTKKTDFSIGRSSTRERTLSYRLRIIEMELNEGGEWIAKRNSTSLLLNPVLLPRNSGGVTARLSRLYCLLLLLWVSHLPLVIVEL